MSASNWAVCPRCFEQAKAKALDERDAVMAMYGRVSVAEFDAARARLEEPDEDTFITFREDYHLYGAESGEVEVSYSGACDVCGLSAQFEGTKRFWPDNRPFQLQKES